jgi:hypothetical protein
MSATGLGTGRASSTDEGAAATTWMKIAAALHVEMRRDGWKPGVRVGERIPMKADDLGPIGFCGLHCVTPGAINSRRSRGK